MGTLVGNGLCCCCCVLCVVRCCALLCVVLLCCCVVVMLLCCYVVIMLLLCCYYVVIMLLCCCYVVVMLLLCCCYVVVVVEWLYYCKKIIIDKRADLSDFSFIFESTMCVFVSRPMEIVTFFGKTVTPQNGLLIFLGKETHSETKSWKSSKIFRPNQNVFIFLPCFIIFSPFFSIFYFFFIFQFFIFIFSFSIFFHFPFF